MRHLAAILALMLCFIGCAKAQQPEASQSDGALACDRPVIELGDIYDPKVSHEFTVRNTSNQPITISKIGRSCSCMDAELGKSTLDAGETTTIKSGTYVNPSEPGALTKFASDLTVHVDDNPVPAIRLRVQGNYIPPAYRLSTILNTTVDEPGDDFSETFEVFVNDQLGVDITEAQVVGHPEVMATVSPYEGPANVHYKKRSIRIKGSLPEDVPLPSFLMLEVYTTSPDLPMIGCRLSVRQTARDRITFSPPVISFGILQNGETPAKKTLILRIPDAFKGEHIGTRTDIVGLTVEPVRPVNAGGNVVRLDILFDPSDRPVGSIAGNVSVATSAETIDIPVSGFIKASDRENASNISNVTRKGVSV